jgi:hypothetical protein
MLREGEGFHAYQILEAGVRQFTEWNGMMRALNRGAANPAANEIRVGYQSQDGEGAKG